MTAAPFTVDDLHLHRKVLEAVPHPHGGTVACTVQSVDRDNDGYRYAVWTVPLDGGPPRQRSAGASLTANTPRWSPDGGTLAFVSSESGSMQLHAVAFPGAAGDEDGGDAAEGPWGHFPGGVSDFRWFPDGRALLVASGVSVDSDLRGARPGVRDQTRPAGVEVAWKLPYKSDGIGFLLNREIRLFRLDPASGAQEQLTEGAFDVLGFDIAADGGRIAYARTGEGRFAHRSELWLCRADGGGHRPLAQDLATVATPAWSPDGRWLAFTGARLEGDGQTTLWPYDADADRYAPFATEELEIAAGTAPHWSADGRQLFFVQAFRGRHRIVSADLAGRGLRTLVAGDRQFGAFCRAGDTLAYAVDRPDLPSDLWASTVPEESAGGETHERRLTDLNPWWRERTPLRVELRTFEVPDGQGGTERIDGWLLAAEGTRGPAPLLCDAHGGPASYALLDFDSAPFRQALCARGWRVLALNTVGSSSYGRAFCERLAGRWGALDLPQYLAALDRLRDDGLCDDRVALSGKSYGGFLSCWAIGHTDRFRAAVVMAPVGNIETHYGTSDGGYYADPFYLRTAPAFDRERARALSPLQYVERATTPTLFLQGKEDERCPKCQSEELFVSMMRAGGTPTELVLYPGEGHSFLGSGAPAHRADACRRILAWVDRHADGRAAPAPALAASDAHRDTAATAA
ncbi:MAG: S9 family peptidase [Xylophilus ampelinus]